MQIRPWGLLAYDHKEFSSYHDDTRERPKREIVQYSGRLTAFSKKRLKRAIGLIVATAKEKEAPNFKTGNKFKFKLNFLTFTLPAPQGSIKDKEVKHCLDNWIKRAKRKYNLKSYVWRAERQGNGAIHFHMITDTYIRYDHIRNDWNSCLRPLGLIDQFKAKHGHENPNSTDVHAIWKIRNLTAYFVKYMSKEHKEGEEPIQGKIWDCSKNLKTKENCKLDLIGETREAWDTIIQDESLNIITDANFTIIFVPEERRAELYPKMWQAKWEEYLNLIREAESIYRSQ